MTQRGIDTGSISGPILAKQGVDHMQCIKRLSILGFVLLLTGCGRQGAANTEVEWAALRDFDHAADWAEVQAQRPLSEDEKLAVADRLLTAGTILLESSVPANVHSRALVDQRLAETQSLLAELAASDPIDQQLLLAFHPLAAAFVEEAGLPHIHDYQDEGHDD